MLISYHIPNNEKPMFVNCVYVHVKQEHLPEFIEITSKNHEGSRTEPGNLRFDVLQQFDDPTRFLLYEVWDTEEAAAAHKNTPHYQEWKAAVENWMESPRKGVKHRIICPSDRSKW